HRDLPCCPTRRHSDLWPCGQASNERRIWEHVITFVQCFPGQSRHLARVHRERRSQLPNVRGFRLAGFRVQELSYEVYRKLTVSIDRKSTRLNSSDVKI